MRRRRRMGRRRKRSLRCWRWDRGGRGSGKKWHHGRTVMKCRAGACKERAEGRNLSWGGEGILTLYTLKRETSTILRHLTVQQYVL